MNVHTAKESDPEMLLDWLGAIVVFAAIALMFFGPRREPDEEEHLDRDW